MNLPRDFTKKLSRGISFVFNLIIFAAVLSLLEIIHVAAMTSITSVIYEGKLWP